MGFVFVSTQEVQPEQEEKLCCEYVRGLEQAAERGYGVSSGQTEKLSGRCDPGQPALGHPA